MHTQNFTKFYICIMILRILYMYGGSLVTLLLVEVSAVSVLRSQRKTE